MCAALAVAGCGGMEGGDEGAQPATETTDTAGVRVTGSAGVVYTYLVADPVNFPATYQMGVHWTTSVPTTSILRIKLVNAVRNDPFILLTESVLTTQHSFSVELAPVANYQFQVISTLGDGTTDTTQWLSFTTPPGKYDVGVVPAAPTTGTWPNFVNPSCPNQHPVVFQAGNEWTRNRNDSSGWIGANYQSGGKWFLNMCRVDGRKFKPIVSARNMIYDYAVIQLGTTCPNGSMPFNKYIDGEDDGSYSIFYDDNGGTSPPGSLGPNWGQTDGGNMQLYWCLFTNGTSLMSAFPQLVPNQGYGVYAPTDFPSPWALDRGWIYMDDEDSGNADVLSPDIEAVQRIVLTGSNTKINLARVR